MLEAYDRTLKKRAVLDKAFDKREEEKLNAVGTLRFSLPGTDLKTEHCGPFSFVKSDAGTFYRVLLPKTLRKDYEIRSYTAEHCIATLVDDVMFRSTVIGGTGMYTADVIRYILGQQTVQHWKLGECDFTKQFEYGFESENLYNALMAVANLFVEPYMWTYDFSSYPWTVSLKRLDGTAKPQFYIRAGKNLIEEGGTRDGTQICTRLYLLGFGEGDNQLGVESVNNGKAYIQSPQMYIDRYGLISKVYVDRSFEDAESLLARGQTLLTAMQDPPYARSFGVADLYAITRQPYDHAAVGDVVRLSEDGSMAFVTGVSRNLDKDGDMKIELSTTAADVVQSVADLADRQRIEQVYAQGATQIYAQSVQANADASTPAVLSFYIPDRMRIVNKVEAKIRIESFRSYNRVTRGGGASTYTSSDGGGGAITSGSDGGSTRTSTAGGDETVTSGPSSRQATSQTSLETTAPSPHFTDYSGAATYTGPANGNTGSAGGDNTGPSSGYTASASGSGTGSPSNNTTGLDFTSGSGHQHSMVSHTHSESSHTHGLGNHTHTAATHSHDLGSHTHPFNHLHQFDHTHGYGHVHSIDHTHSITTTAHTHSVTVPSHTHSVSLPSHSHSVSVPEHTHQIEQGIFRYGSPSGGSIEVNGTARMTMERDGTFDLTPYLLNASGTIPRNAWIQLGVRPDDLAYIIIDIFVQGFVQSRGGGTH